MPNPNRGGIMALPLQLPQSEDRLMNYNRTPTYTSGGIDFRLGAGNLGLVGSTLAHNSNVPVYRLKPAEANAKVDNVSISV